MYFLNILCILQYILYLVNIKYIVKIKNPIDSKRVISTLFYWNVKNRVPVDLYYILIT
jgi:hypothetical protein